MMPTQARNKAAKILGFNDSKNFLKDEWPILLSAKNVIKLQGNNEVSIALIKTAIKKEIIQKRYEETDYMASDNPAVTASDFALLLKEIGLKPSESINAWYESTTPQTEAMGDVGKGNHAGTKPKEREVMAWLRETWINEGKLGGVAFFNKLKKYVNQAGSPIVEHYSAGKDAGFKWKTSAETTGRMTKKTISNKVSIFKSKP